MKKITVFLFLLIVNSSPILANDGKVISCALNRSFYIDIVPIKETPGYRNSYDIFYSHFSDGRVRHIATLDRPEIINLGDVLMLFQDFGKSGYVFIRIEGLTAPSAGLPMEGYLDLNLFLLEEEKFPKGRLHRTFCFRKNAKND